MSELLSNRVVADKHAVEYFTDKFEDPMMFAQVAESKNVPVIVKNKEIVESLTNTCICLFRTIGLPAKHHIISSEAAVINIILMR